MADSGRPFCADHSAAIRKALIERDLGDRICDDADAADRVKSMLDGITRDNFDAMIYAELVILKNIKDVSLLLTLMDCPLCVGNDMIRLGIIDVTDGENFDQWIPLAADGAAKEWQKMQAASEL